jgi:hypothetical integral membrane protein (TIGR02206 family)
LDAFDPEHLAALGVVAAVALVSTAEARAHPGPWVVTFSRSLAVLILAAYAVDHLAAALSGEWSLRRYLPLHLTDVVTIVSALALWSPRPLLFELTYFWGLTASLQATLTPDLGDGFPSVFYLTYFVTHGGVVVAAIFLAAGRRLVPRPGSVPRVFGITLALAVVAGVGDLITGGNYMFLRHKPGSASLLDLMGPWPLYILAGAALALVLFHLLDTPFRRRRAPAPAGVPRP